MGNRSLLLSAVIVFAILHAHGLLAANGSIIRCHVTNKLANECVRFGGKDLSCIKKKCKLASLTKVKCFARLY